MQKWAITYYNKESGLRALAFQNTRGNFYDSKEVAEQAIELYGPDMRAKLPHMRAIEARMVECYENGDAVSIYSTMRLRRVTGRPFLTFCVCCGFKLHYAGDSEIDPRVEWATHYPVWADETGTAFKAYYCNECAKSALELQAAVQS